jgi:hypothetical protein
MAWRFLVVTKWTTCSVVPSRNESIHRRLHFVLILDSCACQSIMTQTLPEEERCHRCSS